MKPNRFSLMVMPSRTGFLNVCSFAKDWGEKSFASTGTLLHASSRPWTGLPSSRCRPSQRCDRPRRARIPCQSRCSRCEPGCRGPLPTLPGCLNSGILVEIAGEHSAARVRTLVYPAQYDAVSRDNPGIVQAPEPPKSGLFLAILKLRQSYSIGRLYY